MDKTYEQAYSEFEEIVKKLQNDDVAIDEAVELFKRGIELKNQCQKILDDAEKNITLLLNDSKELVGFTHEKE